MNFVTKFLSVLGLTVALSTNAVAAVVLVKDNNGTLMGASGVNVGGTFYDVTFGDGLLNWSSITAFTTQASAILASQSLLDQVFSANYADLTLSTNGCSSPSRCSVYTSYALGSDSGDNANDYIYAAVTTFRFDRKPSIQDLATNIIEPVATTSNMTTIARWSPVEQIAAIPEPETYAMFLAGLGLLGFVSRRRKQKAAV